MSTVRAKKHLGQHFLNDQNIARKIAETLTGQGYDIVLEIGPGMGVLTQFLLLGKFEVHVVEIDTESVEYLEQHYTALQGKIHARDFLKFPLQEVFGENPLAIIGNFPYNISTQIVFRMLEQRDRIPEFSGMFQKEVAERICETKGSKTYGILSVLVQAFYKAEYLFTVPPQVFSPPPKVQSGVLRLTRKEQYRLPCSEKLFFNVVKTAFNQRRKTLRNSLKSIGIPEVLKEDSIFDRRPEQLSTEDFIALTQKLENHGV